MREVLTSAVFSKRQNLLNCEIVTQDIAPFDLQPQTLAKYLLAPIIIAFLNGIKRKKKGSLG